MKKINVIISMLALASTATWAQPQYSDLDTVVGKPREYYTQEWYDRCPQYAGGQISLNDAVALSGQYSGNGVLANEYVVGGRMEVRGLAALVAIDVQMDTTYISGELPLERLPETLYLLQGLGPVRNTGLIFPREMMVVDSLRWDNVEPRVIRLPLRANATADSDYVECYSYEVYFDEPVIVDSVFYVAGTERSNVTRLIEVDPATHGGINAVYRYVNYPTVYSYVMDTEEDVCQKCLSANRTRSFGGGTNRWAQPERWRLRNYCADQLLLWSGPLFAIATMHRLTLNVSDPEAGHVEGGGDYPHLSTATATAVPNMGHTFSHWSDGVTDNPRTIEMNGDSSLVAFFH